MIILMLALISVPMVFVFASGGLSGIITFFSSGFTAGKIGLLIVLAIVFFLIVSISQALGRTALLYAIKDSQEGIGVIEAYR